MDLSPTAELEITGRIMPASNATFLGDLDGVQVVYKPVAGERPLWDFPTGTLAGREVASYLVSEATGWGVVPETWIGDGPRGPGMVQRWQDVDPEQEAVTLVPADEVPEGLLHVLDGLGADERPVSLVHEDTAALRRMAVLDLVLNNADRKGGHVLAMPDGHRHGVDHGLTFHDEPKLRTVLWGWIGRELDAEERAGVERARDAVAGDLAGPLLGLVTEAELEATLRRCDRLLARGTFPPPDPGSAVVPWPPF